MASIHRVACSECQRPLPPRIRKGGRPRLYCSDACRMRARRRKRALPWPPSPPPSFPSDPKVVAQRTGEAIVLALTTDLEAPAEDQLGQGLLEIDWLVYRLARLEPELPIGLAARTGELAKRMHEARVHLFPTEAVPA